MYTDTTKVQVVRATGVWALGLGLAMLPFLGGQLFVWDEPFLLLVDLAFIACGAAMLWGARRWLAAADASNRDYLLSEQGARVMRGRKERDSRLGLMAWVLFGVFMVLGVAFVVLMSAAGCGDRTDGFCGDVGRPSDAVMTTMQVISLGVGALWVGALSLKRTHEKESERIDRVVAEGQRRRRNDHPMAGSGRTGWE